MLGFLAISSPTHARLPDEAPPPKAAPRLPVKSETIPDATPPHTETRRAETLPNTTADNAKINADAPRLSLIRQYEGPATIIDAERLAIGDVTLRLFGIVLGQNGTVQGDAARAALQSLTQKERVRCQVRDRDARGTPMATCATAQTDDLGLALVQKGLAMVARGSVAGTDLATPYARAETAAVAAGLGLWARAALAQETPKPPPEKPISEKSEFERSTAKTLLPVIGALPPLTTTNGHGAAPTFAGALPLPPSPSASNGSLAPVEILLQDAAPPPARDTSTAQNIGFIERYQIILAALVLLLAALIALAAAWLWPRQRTRAETRAVAAALAGELMAARSICQNRAQDLWAAPPTAPVTWPRLRVFVFRGQADRIGLLGATLARKVASLYGQFADYAAFQERPQGGLKAGEMAGVLTRLALQIGETIALLEKVAETGLPFSIAPPTKTTETMSAEKMGAEKIGEEKMGAEKIGEGKMGEEKTREGGTTAAIEERSTMKEETETEAPNPRAA